jgi:chloride channel 2
MNGTTSSNDDDGNSNNINNNDDDNHPSKKQKQSILSLVWSTISLPFLLILISLLTSLISLLVTLSTNKLYHLRHAIVVADSVSGSVSDSALNDTGNEAAASFATAFTTDAIRFTGYILLSVTSALLSCYLTQTLCPSAVGSGIPEIKSILTGTHKSALLSPSLILTKTLGLIFAYTAGLSVGKEGPMVHISVAIASCLMSTPLFKRVSGAYLDDAKRLEIIAAAAASGVGATFGTPFSSVIFSIEVTGDFFMVRNLPRTFICGVTATLFCSLYGTNKVFSLFGDLPKTAKGYDVVDILTFTTLGVTTGLAGCVFIYGIERVIRIRNWFINGDGTNGGGSSGGNSGASKRRYKYVFMITLVVSVFVFFDLKYGIASAGDQRSITNIMFQTSSLISTKFTTFSIVVYMFLKFFITVLSTTLPLPVGLFTPVFLIGGTIGRLYGELLRHIITSQYLPPSIIASVIQTSFHPWEYALIGAAAFTSSVTRTISTSLIILELSGEHHLRTPTAVAVLVAYYVGDRFCKSVYDVLRDVNSVPSLGDYDDAIKGFVAGEVMYEIRNNSGDTDNETIPYLTLNTTVREAIITIEKQASKLTDNTKLPVVTSDDSMLLIGDFIMSDLRYAVSCIVNAASMVSDSESVVMLDQTIVFVTNNNGVLAPMVGSNGVQNKIIPKDWAVLLDPAPYSMQDATQMAKIHLVFRMLKLNQAYVTHHGKLVGFVNRKGLRRFVKKREELNNNGSEIAEGCRSFLVKECCSGGGRVDGVDDEDDEDEDEEEEFERGSAKAHFLRI